MNQFDVIVVGGGVAGIYAAEQAVRAGAKTTLVSKGEIGRVGVRGSGASGCGSTYKGIPAFFRLLDESFDGDAFRDQTISAGLGMVEREMVSFFVDEFIKMKSSAEDIMSLYQRPGPWTLGTPLIRAHMDFVTEGAEIHGRTTAARLLVRDNVCSGVLCVDESTGHTFPLYGKSVVLAAGGDAGLFAVNVHPQCVSGDGYALGLRAGAEAINLEFMQIFTMTTAPTRNLIHFFSEEHLADLRNGEGDEFLSNYLPEGISREQCIRENILHAPFSVRDAASRYLAIGIVGEIAAGRATPSGGICVDLRDFDSFMDSTQAEFLRSRGIDASAAPVEITMGFQCCNGGLRVNTKMATTVEGLYAAGENAGGLHGADRLGGNMLAGCMIFGRIAGEQAAGFARKRSAVEQQSFRPVQLIATGIGPAEKYSKLITELRQSAWDNLLVVKSGRSVERFRNRSMEIAEEVRMMAGDPKDVPVEMENLLVVGKALAAATLERTESRGGFYRHDHPDPSPEIPEAHIITLSQDNEIALRREVLDPDWNPDYQNTLDRQRWG